MGPGAIEVDLPQGEGVIRSVSCRLGNRGCKGELPESGGPVALDGGMGSVGQEPFDKGAELVQVLRGKGVQGCSLLPGKGDLEAALERIEAQPRRNCGRARRICGGAEENQENDGAPDEDGHRERKGHGIISSCGVVPGARIPAASSPATFFPFRVTALSYAISILENGPGCDALPAGEDRPSRRPKRGLIR